MLAVHANIFHFMLQHPKKDEGRDYGGAHILQYYPMS